MPSRNLSDADPKLAEAFKRGVEAYQTDHPDKSLIITCTHRSVDEQKALYAQGRTKPGNKVTNVDGVRQKSNHNYLPARAVDFAIVSGGKTTWVAAEYDVAGPYFEKEGLVWGGRWKSIVDRPHVELPKEM